MSGHEVDDERREEVRNFLLDAGIDVGRGRARNLAVSCPNAEYSDEHGRKVDNHPSMGVLATADAVLSNCFTCGMKARSLASLFGQLARKDAERWQKWADLAGAIDGDGLDKVKTVKAYGDRPALAVAEDEPFEESILEDFEDLPEEGRAYFAGRDIVETGCWRPLWDAGARRVVLPVRGMGGELVGAVGRSTLSHARPKYLNYWQFGKDNCLLGAHLAQPDRLTVVVEGPLDAVKARQALGESHNVAATFGAHLSDRQADMLVELGRGVVLMFDNDEPGWKVRASTIERLQRRTYLAVAEYGAKDPGSMKDEDIRRVVLGASVPGLAF